MSFMFVYCNKSQNYNGAVIIRILSITLH